MRSTLPFFLSGAALSAVLVVLLAGPCRRPPAPSTGPAPPSQAQRSDPDATAPVAAPTADPLEDLEPATRPIDGLLLRRVRHRERVFRVATLDLRRVTAELAGQDGLPLPATFTALSQALAAKGERLVWGTNAGIFHAGGRPAGLFIADGTVHRGLETADGAGNFYLKPNGALLIDAHGARIRTTDELVGQPLDGVRLATQSGPMLARAGSLHPALRADSPNRLLRSGVGVADPHTLHFAISEGPVRFHELATLFRDGLHAPDALYLDGVISQWVDPDTPPGAADGGFSGLLFVAVEGA